jgi:hypothetical protein
MTRSYELLNKDKEIIATEVLNEYNQGVGMFCTFLRLTDYFVTVRVSTHTSNT